MVKTLSQPTGWIIPFSLSARVITKNNRSRFFQVENGLVEGKLI
jgi:hypothetical protein